MDQRKIYYTDYYTGQLLSVEATAQRAGMSRGALRHASLRCHSIMVTFSFDQARLAFFRRLVAFTNGLRRRSPGQMPGELPAADCARSHR
jgi:hypothetical protein